METVTGSSMASALREVLGPRQAQIAAAVEAAKEHLSGGAKRLAQQLLEM